MKTFGIKTIDNIAVKHKSKIESVSDERQFGDGIFIYLKNGFFDFCHDPHVPTQTIHEWNLKDLIERLRLARKPRKNEIGMMTGSGESISEYPGSIQVESG